MRIDSAFARAAVYVVALLAGISAQAQRRSDAPSIVTTNCSGCHGIDGNTAVPYFPRLAGLDADYADSKMTEFKNTRPPASIQFYGWIRDRLGKQAQKADTTRNAEINMVGVAHSAKSEELKEANLWYASQRPAHRKIRNATLFERGQDMYTKGVPEKDIMPCMSCHGQNAKGDGSTPRLAGQNSQYIEAQMKKFGLGNDAVMSAQARDLTPEQTRAIAVYLESQ